jgi:hypothetical protein
MWALAARAKFFSGAVARASKDAVFEARILPDLFRRPKVSKRAEVPYNVTLSVVRGKPY